MNLPANKEETDRILFELLEGNLPALEQEFWYDYALKNNEFAKQLALFRKIYMHEDPNMYPDHSKLLRKSPWTAFWKNPFFIAGSTLFLGATAFYIYTLQVSPQIQEQVIPVRTEQILKEEKKELLISSETEEVKKDLPAKSTGIIQAASPQEDIKEEKHIEKTTEQRETNPGPILIKEKTIPVLKDSVKVKEDPVIIIKEEVIEKQEPAVPAQIPEAGESKKDKANGLKLKVKPSRKTKPTDFNY